MRLLIVLLVVALVVVPAAAQINQQGVQLLNEGSPLGRAVQLNCVGAGINCTLSGGQGILTVTGGGGGSGVSSVNLLTGDLTLAPNRAISITTNGSDTITIGSTGVDYLTAGNGISLNTHVGSVTVTNTNPPVYISAGVGISVNNNVGSVTITNTGSLTDTYLLAGPGISIDHPIGSVTVTNTNPPVFISAGTGIAVSANVGSVTVSNTKTETYLLAGAGIAIDHPVGSATITNTLPPVYIIAGTGISVDNHVGSVTITNTGSGGGNPPVFLIAGTGISLNASVGSVTVTNAGVTSAIGTANQVIVSGATGDVTFSLPQNIATSSTPTFASITSTNAAAGSTFASCVQVNAAGTFSNTGASCTTVNALAGRLNIVAGSNVTVTTTPPDTISIASTGGGSSNPPVYILPGTGISVDHNVGSVTVTNSGVTSLNYLTGNLTIASGTTGPGITISSPTSSNIRVDIANELWSVAPATVTVANSSSLTSVNIAVTLGSSASEMWGFECTIVASASASNTQDFKFGWSLPAGVDGVWGPQFATTTSDYWSVDTSVSAIALPNINSTISFGTGAAVLSRTGIFFRGTIVPGGNAGQALLTFSQAAATALHYVTVSKGSYCVFRRVAT